MKIDAIKLYDWIVKYGSGNVTSVSHEIKNNIIYIEFVAPDNHILRLVEININIVTYYRIESYSYREELYIVEHDLFGLILFIQRDNYNPKFIKVTSKLRKV